MITCVSIAVIGNHIQTHWSAGGLAVAYKLQSSVKRTEATLIITKMHILLTSAR